MGLPRPLMFACLSSVAAEAAVLGRELRKAAQVAVVRAAEL
jgi:hypothetical protein